MRDFRRFVKGVTFKPNDGGSNPIGDLSGVLTAADNGSVYHYQNRLKAFLDAVEREIITNDQAQTITNKTIDADNNTISNIENDNIKAGAAIAESKLDLDYSTSGLNTAITDHIADATDAHDASAVSFNNVSSGLTATEVQGAIDEVEARLQTAETDISNHIADTVDAHDASAISSIPSGNLAATDVQGALNELQSDIDTRALNSDLSNHLSDTTDAHDASAISFDNVASGLAATDVQGAINEVEARVDSVETAASGAQTSINNHLSDTVDAHDASAISSVPSGNLAATDVQGALNELQSDIDTRALASDLTNHISDTSTHGVTGDIVGTSDAQTLTNKTISGASIQSPTRLDVKKDTKANLETYATTASDGQLCFATDEKVMYQVVDNALTEVGAGGGVGSVDIMFADTFNSTAIAEYTTTGTVALTESALEVLQGKKSLKITHTGGASAERIIPVDIKFRNKNVTMSFDVESDAASGNLTLTVTDNTNTVTLINAESIQPQEALQTSVKRSVSFIIPDDCEELKYKFTAVSESGKISIIDNIVIELTQTAKMSTTIEVPVVTDPVDAGTITIGATTTAPTKGVMTTDSVSWYRSGKFAHITYRFHQSSTAGATAGSGEYLYSLPSGLVADTAYVNPFTGASLPDNKRALIGQGEITSASGPTNGATYAVLYDANRFRLYTYAFYSNGNYQSSTFYNLNQAAVGYSITIEVPIVGWSATETQEVSLAQAVLKQESDSYLRITGFTPISASTNTKIISMTNGGVIRQNLGDAIEYLDDSTLGARFIAKKSGLHRFSFSADINSATGTGVGFSLNSNQLTSDFQTIDNASKISASYDTGSGNIASTCYAEVNLNVGDTVRIHLQGTISGANAIWSTFTTSYQGSLKQVNVTENQKIEIPTSELRMEGASTRGSTATAIVRFDNIAKLRGDAFTVESDATLGTRITMKKKGLLGITSSLLGSSTAGYGISKNQTTLTTNALPSNEVLSFSNPSAAGSGETIPYIGHVEVGDIIRIFSGANPTANNGNNLNLSFQEQEVAVSVTNILPQFSESDSSVRVDTANGYGSTATKIRRFSNVRDNLGSAITYNDGSLGVPATVGDYFIVKESGIYNVSYTENFSGVNGYLGISKNAASLITNITSTAATQVLAIQVIEVATGSGNVSWQGYLQKDDVIRAHTNGETAAGTQPTTFTISKVGKPNVTGVDVTPFAGIEYEVTQHFSSALDSSFNFSSIRANTNNGLFTVSDSTANIVVTALKTIKANISVHEFLTGSVAYTLLTVTNNAGQEIMKGVSPWEAGSGLGGGNVTVPVVMQAGQIVTISKTTVGTFVSASIEVVATELRDAYQVIGGGVENTYSARIANNGTASITSQSYPFISSVSRTSLGTITINLVSGFFGVVPSATATAQGTNVQAHIFSISTSQIVVGTATDGAFFDVPISIQIQRQGSDYRTPSKAIGLPQQRIAIIKDLKAAGTAMQSLTGGVWTTRVLNNVIDPTGLVTSLASNVITLPTGTYHISARAPVLSGTSQVSYHKAALYNTTDATYAIVGSTERTLSPSGSSHTGASIIEGRVVITAQKSFDIRHYVTTTQTSADTPPNAASTDEVYTIVTITKLEE